MTTYMPQCIFCKHYRKGPEGPECGAYPNGIPHTILRNERDHRRPLPDDHDIQFEPVDRDGARIVAEMFEEGTA